MLSVLIVDNNDSFTYNLVELLRQTKICNVDVCLLKNIHKKDISIFNGIILSPGPGLPDEKQGLFDFIDFAVNNNKAILGVCLGHQAIVRYFGGSIYKLDKIIHGESSSITVNTTHEIYKNLPQKIDVGRYHSWVADSNNLPNCFEIGAKTDDNLIMSIKHKHKNIYSVQYHPESILTPKGNIILLNWLKTIHHAQ
jgi:anthranilate synthase component 2